MSRYLILLSPILALVSLNLTACMNTSSMINNVPTISTLNDGQGKEPYSVNKHYVLSSVKFLNQQELASDGKTFPTTASGLKGRFYFEEGCLKFVSELTGEAATPIFNYNLVKWNSNNQTLRMHNTLVGMSQLIEGSGEFDQTSKDIKGQCWIENTVYVGSIGVKVLE